MIRYVLVMAALMVATSATAQDVTVRSGEHDGYSRLVVQVPPGTSWVLANKKNGARLTVSIDDVTFKTGSVFSRLTQDRLSALSQSRPGAALEMEFGCDCAASAFLYQDKMIVVDIAPGIALPPLSAELPPPVLPQSAPKSDQRKTIDALDTLAVPLLNQNILEFERQLSTRLLQGADREIVDLNLMGAGPRQTGGLQDLNTLPGLAPNIEVSSILDEVQGVPGSDIPQMATRPACISDAEIGFDSWSDERPFPEQLADLRVGLFQEFDRIDTARATRLAKLYIFHGFGAEARRLLTLSQDQSPEAAWISTIAGVMDEQELDGPNPFTDLQRCSGDVALWAVLTEGVLHHDRQLTAVERSFARLPDHLRRHLGPTLAEILVKAQELEAARRILRTVERVQKGEQPRAIQAEATVASAEGDTPRTETLLTKVIAAPDAAQQAPLALARLVEKRWVERGSVSPQERDLAASYAVELRKSELGLLMQQTHAIALGLNQEFDQALDLAASLPSGTDRTRTFNQVLHLLAERSDDVTFLRRVLDMPRDLVAELTTDTAIVMSERLVKLGFAETARTMASRPQDKIRRMDRARLRARAALLTGRPHQALLALADDPSDDAGHLRARALTAIDDFAAAGHILRDLGETAEADRYFWLAGLPDEVGTDDTSRFARIADITRSLSVPPVRLPDKPLADAKTLLRESAGTRGRITDLFEDLAQP